jgi:uncharacterized protein YbjT (DUF2867 family)
MRIIVVGGSGRIGRKLVQQLQMRGHETSAASPSSGVDTMTGAGLNATLADAQAVVDVTNAPSLDDEAVLKFFQTSTRNLLAAETAANVKHHVVLSIVGVERMLESSYMQAKTAQENLVRAGDVPFSILRSTQFFEFIGPLVAVNTIRNTVYLPPAFLQPVAADDVAEALADITTGGPVNDVIEIAGPERFHFDELIQQFLSAAGDSRQVSIDTQAQYFGAKLEEASLLPGDNIRIGSIRFADWLDRNDNLPAKGNMKRH